MGQRALLRGRGHVPPGFSVKYATVFTDECPSRSDLNHGFIRRENDQRRHGFESMRVRGTREEREEVNGDGLRSGGGESTDGGD